MATRVSTQIPAVSGLGSATVGRVGRRRALAGSDERRLAGQMTGLLYLTGAASAVLMTLLPGAASRHTVGILAVAAAGAVWGVAALTVVPWASASPWLTHVSTACGFVIAAALMAMTGGEESPARFYLFFIVVYAAYFYPAREAVPYFAGCALVLCLPFLYQQHTTHFSYYGEVVVVIPTYFVLGYVILAGKQRLVAMREQADRLAAEQGALRRVATAVAHGLPRDEVYELVAVEAAGLLDAAAAGIVRLESDQECLVIGSWSDGVRRYEPGTRFPVRPGGQVEQLLRTGEPVRTDDYALDSPEAALGYGCGLIAPVRVNERLWGLLAAVHVEPHSLSADAFERLSALRRPARPAIANTEARAKLARQASTDPLTAPGQPPHLPRAAAHEVQRALRHERPLALAVLDVDHFKAINDSPGTRRRRRSWPVVAHG